jgi:peptidoglycan/LPS O-acetylase OafA/YrhL
VYEKELLANRPSSVVWYERIAIVAVVATAASAFVDRANLVKYYNQHPVSYPILVLCVFAIQGLWIWLIARKRRNWARWISIVLTIGAIPSGIWSFEDRLRFNFSAAIVYYVTFVVWIVAILMLVRRDAREWFAGSRPSPKG